MEKISATQAEIDRPSDRTSSGYLNRVLLALLLLLFAGVLVRNAWLGDDAFITLRTVRNFNEGYGLVWNIHERVQAYTHPLWMLLLSLVYFVTTETYYSTIGVSLLLSFAAALIVWRSAYNFAGSLLALLLLMLSKSFVDYTTSGLENPLSYLLLALFFYIYTLVIPEESPQEEFPQESAEQDSAEQESAEQGSAEQGSAEQGSAASWRLFWLTLVATLGVVNRMDVGLIFGPALLHASYLHIVKPLLGGRSFWRGLRGGALPMVLGTLPLWGWFAFSIVYYGFPFPNTAYAKLSMGISQWELYSHGFLYLLDSLSRDPITLITIGVAALCTWWAGDARLRFVMVGILLYVGYVIHIGGDFMSGRFFSVPYLGAVLVLARQQFLTLNDTRSYLLFAGVIVIGLLNPTQAPIFSDRDYKWQWTGDSGIADERGHYYPHYGLLRANSLNRLSEQGRTRGKEEPNDFVHCGIGHRGFVASPYTRLVDFCGLADAFTARLPLLYAPDWRIGHPIKYVPPGYLGTLRTGQNQFRDPNLALFYDKLSQVTQGDIWSRQRFVEIWRFNSGAYDHLLDTEQLRFPDATELTIDDNEKQFDGWMTDAQLFFTDDFEIETTVHGVRINLDNVYHSTHLDIGFSSEYFEVVYFLDGEEIGVQPVTTTPLLLGKRQYSVVSVPQDVVERGYDEIRISPRLVDDDIFTYIHLVNLGPERMAGNEAFLSAFEVQEAFHLYYYFYYGNPHSHGNARAGRIERDKLLPLLLSRLQQTAPNYWTELPSALLIDLLEMPDPLLHAAVMPHLSQNVLLTDGEGVPKIRFVGSAEAETVTVDEWTALRLNLFFLVETAMENDYSTWFGIKQYDGDKSGTDAAGTDAAGTDDDDNVQYTEWMVYDIFPQEPTSKWGQGAIVHLKPLIKLAPGTYEFTFGFWTPQERERLTLEDPNVYWIELGEQHVELHGNLDNQ